MAAILSYKTAVSTILLYIFLVWVWRAFWISKLRKLNPPLEPVRLPGPSTPKVSVIVPARNEEKNISNCLESLLKQTYAHYEIIVVDDRSTDKTPEILKDVQASRMPGDIPSLKIVRIEKLPEGWTGKNYAMFTGSKAATGRYFLFTDADTTHTSESLQTAVTTALTQNIDLLTLVPETESKSFWEKTVQPLAVSSLTLWFHPEKTNDPKSGVVFANGQFILVSREAYEKVGGNEAVKNEVVEDVALAKKLKEACFTVKFLDGTLIYSTRMYSSLKEINVGWTRIFTYLFNKNVPAILHKIFLFLLFSILPFVVCGLEKYFYFTHSAHFDKTILLLSAAVSGIIVLVRFIGNKMLRSNPWYAFLHPLGSLMMIWILSVCVTRIALRRPSVWRGQYHK